MNLQARLRWILLLSCFLVVVAFVGPVTPAGAAGFVGTNTCIDCHSTWADNDPPVADMLTANASLGYVPLNLLPTHAEQPFYTIPEGYTGSIHNITAFNLVDQDFVKCEGCHGSGIAHFGIGQIPVPIPQAKTCGTCHNDTHGFDLAEFMATAHANTTKHPGKYFDQPFNGTKQATQTHGVPEKVFLFQQGTFGPVGDAVSRNMRIQECSVCHSYALNYPQFTQHIVQGNMPNPQVSCGACHDAHIVAPDGLEPVVVGDTIKVTAVSGSNVLAATPVQGRSMYPLNHKPFPVNTTGAWDAKGVWTRGSAVARPSIAIVKGTGTLATNGTTTLTSAGGGFLGKVEPMNTVLLSGEASGTATLPTDAVDAGKPVTVKVTLFGAGFEVEEVDSDNTLVLAQAPTVSVGVTYKKATTGTGTLNVPVTFSGPVTFDIRDMYTNTEALCMSCHTRGKYRFSAWGNTKSDKTGTSIDVSATHNANVGGQYLSSGHARRTDAAWAEFSAWEFGSSHQVTYPFDMSITGSGGVNSLRNGGFSQYTLTQTPNASNAYLVAAGNTTQVPLISNYACDQCHHGLGAINYLDDVQGTPDASVLWGDATVTCVTCHDPHATGAGSNIRIPVKLSYNSAFVDATKNPRGGINKMMDGTDIPSGAGKGIICLFCHQARESGLTVYYNINSKGVNPYTDPNKIISPAGLSYQNAHYLGGGALLWSKNFWEYFFNMVPQTYSNGVAAHQTTNCNGCHMGEATPSDFEGGHTWRPKIETCQNQSCHGPTLPDFFSVMASGDYDGNGKVGTAFEEIGIIADNGATGTGLFGRLLTALNAKGIYYKPDSYPYFFDAADNQYRAWTSATFTAAFNLGFSFKTGTSVYVHNAWYVAQVLQDSLKALGVDTSGCFRPAGQRNATYYPDIVINP